MKNKITLIIAILLTFSCLAALPSAFTKRGNPELYRQIRLQARHNLKNLDSDARKAYQRLLKDHNDILMHYLIAYEIDGILQIADPHDVYSNYQQIVQLLETKEFDLEPEFFLSYVAKQTVADERIQAYRKAFMDDGLAEVLASATDELDLYRKVCDWGLERLVFQPTSGRDLSPLDITTSSYLGRCEEMQILFIAAARTVGLPSRPASAPWWAHQDNNHAWAEVWLDGAWHYTGDMDAAYFPDQTWFSGLIDKTVLILANGSLASSNDEVIASGRYHKSINSTPNYAGERTREVQISVLDEAGQAVPEAALGIFVYNWGSLRPISYFRTDEEGQFTISVGRGAFYLAAQKEDKHAITLVPSSEESSFNVDMVISELDLPDQNQILHYPSNEFEWQQAPQSYQDNVKRIKELIAERDKGFARYELLPQGVAADSLYWKVYAACRGNALEFKLFADRVGHLEPGFLSYLLSDDSKLLWQMKANQFEALYNFYLEHKFFDYSEDELRLIISPAVYYEELPQPIYDKKRGWQLYPKMFYQSGNTELEKLANISRFMAKRYKVRPEKALAGLLPASTAWGRKHLTALQKRILAVNVARANGIPAAFARIPNLIVAKIMGEWQYYDIEKGEIWSGGEQEEAVMGSLKVSVQDEEGQPISIDASKLVVTKWEDANFYALNHSFRQAEDGSYTLELPQNKYYLQFGYRISDSQTGFLMQKIDFEEADSLAIVLKPQQYPRAWQEMDDFVASIIGEELLETDQIIILGSLDHENSLRTLDKVKALDKEFIWLGYQEMSDPPSYYQFCQAWQDAVNQDQRNAVRVFTLVKKDGKWQMFEGVWDEMRR